MPAFGLAALLLPAVLAREACDASGACGLSPEAAPQYLVERKGQDTHVRRASDGEVVYTTSVADTSEGSDTDSDLKGDEEFFHGCMWTFRQKLELCEGGNCGEAEILAHDLQRRLLAFYRDRAAPVAPPLEQAAWLTLGTLASQRRELADSCPGLVVTVLFFMAEVLHFTDSAAAEAYAREAEAYAAVLEQGSSAQFQTMLDMFPVREAWEGLERARMAAPGLGGRAEGAAPAGPSVDIVIARCISSLQWLWELDYPVGTRVFVYDKCGRGPEELQAQTAGLVGAVASVQHVPAGEAGGARSGLMTGECTAYLGHITRALAARDLADFTVFLHDDAPRHIRLALLSLALRGLRSGGYRVPFLHLSHERYPSFRTPCLREVYRHALGEELQGSLGTYCCAHFVVGRERIQSRPLEFYERLAGLVNEAPYARSRGGGCNIGTKPCYVIEFLWHRIFGEADELPLRAEQASLPLALRYEGGRASRLPSPLQLAPYMALYQPSRFSSRLAASR